jgi:hydroxyacylglutathione hydrolase
MDSLEINILTALKDNYVYVLHDKKSGVVAVVDPSDSTPVFNFLREQNLQLDMILNTHHHPDHVGGNLALAAHYHCEIYCSDYDFSRVPGATKKLNEGENVFVGQTAFQVLNVPGHTLGAISFYSSAAGVVFTGDTLFTLGCGRLFEGTPEQMFSSLQRLAGLPAQTLIYCGHEYGLQNAAFASAIRPQDIEIKRFFEKCQSFKTTGARSIPSTIEAERKLNPFLKAQNPDEFRTTRLLKDDFRLEN